MSPNPKRFAEMTPRELADWWFMQNRNVADTMAALRDAIRAECNAEWTDIVDSFRNVAASAEQERDTFKEELTILREAWVDRERTFEEELRTAESALATEREDNRNLAAQIEAINGRAESALGEARREAFIAGASFVGRGGNHLTAGDIITEADARYPATPSGEPFTHDAECELERGAWACECPRVRATPSGEGVTKCDGKCGEWCVGRDNAKCGATPQSSEPLVIPVEQEDIGGWADSPALRLTITPEIARRLVAMGQTTTEGR